MRKYSVIALLLLGMAGIVNARQGAWSDSGYGGQLQLGKQPLTSRPLTAPPSAATDKERVYSVAWSVDSTTLPRGMVIRLCSAGQCLRLPGASGYRLWPQTSAPLAQGTFVFVYQVNQPGRLPRPWVVKKNELTVNYR